MNDQLNGSSTKVYEKLMPLKKGQIPSCNEKTAQIIVAMKYAARLENRPDTRAGYLKTMAQGRLLFGDDWKCSESFLSMVKRAVENDQIEGINALIDRVENDLPVAPNARLSSFEEVELKTVETPAPKKPSVEIPRTPAAFPAPCPPDRVPRYTGKAKEIIEVMNHLKNDGGQVNSLTEIRFSEVMSTGRSMFGLGWTTSEAYFKTVRSAYLNGQIEGTDLHKPSPVAPPTPAPSANGNSTTETPLPPTPPTPSTSLLVLMDEKQLARLLPVATEFYRMCSSNVKIAGFYLKLVSMTLSSNELYNELEAKMGLDGEMKPQPIELTNPDVVLSAMKRMQPM
jgi:hypothetical protein